jgi:hypothetical protein
LTYLFSKDTPTRTCLAVELFRGIVVARSGNDPQLTFTLTMLASSEREAVGFARVITASAGGGDRI